MGLVTAAARECTSRESNIADVAFAMARNWCAEPLHFDDDRACYVRSVHVEDLPHPVLRNVAIRLTVGRRVCTRLVQV
jgi:hypothetical protein